MDHCYIPKDKNLTKKEEDKIKNKILYIILTELNEIYIIQGVEKAIDNASKKNNQKPNVLQEKPKESDAPKVDEQALKELQEEMKTKD